jgi:hypothetical protein
MCLPPLVACEGDQSLDFVVSLGVNHVFDYEVHLLEDLGCLVESVTVY